MRKALKSENLFVNVFAEVSEVARRAGLPSSAVVSSIVGSVWPKERPSCGCEAGVPRNEPLNVGLGPILEFLRFTVSALPGDFAVPDTTALSVSMKDRLRMSLNGAGLVSAVTVAAAAAEVVMFWAIAVQFKQ